MKPEQRARWVAGLLLGAWLIVVAWQVDEHRRVLEAARSDLQHRSREIVNILSAVTHALSFGRAIIPERLSPILSEMIQTTNETSHLVAISLLNTNGDSVLAVGDTNLLSHEEIVERERWTDTNVTFVMTVEGASVNAEGVTNYPAVVLPSISELTNTFTNGMPLDFSRHEPHFGDTNFAAGDHGPPPMITNAAGEVMPASPPPEGRGHFSHGSGRPWWLRGMSESDFRALVAKRELHGLVVVMSTENYRAISIDDLWLRCIIAFFAAVSAFGAAFAWRNTSRTAELQIRLVRASELNSHLKEMNLAAAGLAHETRNPLNIIRGLAQMVSRLPDASPEVRAQSKTIVDETDKVTAQLTEFINYSRPREVRRTRVSLPAAAAEVVRTLNFDIEEKKLKVETGGETTLIEADEQLLRQVLFNLLLNAIQAADVGGQIKFEVRRTNATTAVLEIRDDGPGVLPENRQEIFKPYFTTHQKGTGLGLAVVSQIVLAHGWEIQYLPNTPRGAIFRITHLRIAG